MSNNNQNNDNFVHAKNKKQYRDSKLLKKLENKNYDKLTQQKAENLGFEYNPKTYEIINSQGKKVGGLKKKQIKKIKILQKLQSDPELQDKTIVKSGRLFEKHHFKHTIRDLKSLVKLETTRRKIENKFGIADKKYTQKNEKTGLDNYVIDKKNLTIVKKSEKESSPNKIKFSPIHTRKNKGMIDGAIAGGVVAGTAGMLFLPGSFVTVPVSAALGAAAGATAGGIIGSRKENYNPSMKLNHEKLREKYNIKPPENYFISDSSANLTANQNNISSLKSQQMNVRDVKFGNAARFTPPVLSVPDKSRTTRGNG